MSKSGQPTDVVWLAPELFGLGQGQYRDVPEGIDPVDGKLVIWVDDTPEVPDDGTGHFEFYDGAEADYTPTWETRDGTVIVRGTYQPEEPT